MMMMISKRDDMDEIEPIPLEKKDITDEEEIKSTISEFYGVANAITKENKQDIIRKLFARRNVLLNMMRVYLINFDNELILKEFETDIVKAKDEATDNGNVRRYLKYLNEIKTISVYLGKKEDMMKKKAIQFYAKMKESKYV